MTPSYYHAIHVFFDPYASYVARAVDCVHPLQACMMPSDNMKTHTLGDASSSYPILVI